MLLLMRLKSLTPVLLLMKLLRATQRKLLTGEPPPMALRTQMRARAKEREKARVRARARERTITTTTKLRAKAQAVSSTVFSTTSWAAATSRLLQLAKVSAALISRTFLVEQARTRGTPLATAEGSSQCDAPLTSTKPRLWWLLLLKCRARSGVLGEARYQEVLHHHNRFANILFFTGAGTGLGDWS
jgi:hypothetical protein